MAFNAIASQETLADFIDPVDKLVYECKLHLNEDGLNVRAVEPANVGMVRSDLDADGFESYEASGGLLGLNVNRFVDVLGMADAGELVHLQLDEETRKLHIDTANIEYTMALIDPDTVRSEPDLPDLDLPAEVVIEGNQFDQMITAADVISDHLSFGLDAAKEMFYMYSEGDTDDVRVEYDRDEVIDMQAGEAHSLFSLDYLKDMNKAIGSDVELSMSIGEEFPIEMAFETAEGHGDVQYMLAPRIQAD